MCARACVCVCVCMCVRVRVFVVSIRPRVTLESRAGCFCHMRQHVWSPYPSTPPKHGGQGLCGSSIPHAGAELWASLGRRVLGRLYGLCCHSQGPLVVSPAPSFLFLIFASREDLGFRFISEQVSHHPPISAFYSEGLHQDFLFHGSIYPKLKFWGKSVEAEPRGTITLELLK